MSTEATQPISSADTDVSQQLEETSTPPANKQVKMLPVLYVLPGASDGPDGKGKPDVDNYTFLGKNFMDKGLISEMRVVAYDLHAASTKEAIPADIAMPAEGQQVWLLVHSFGVNFADALIERIKPSKVYTYGAYCAKWKVDKNLVKPEDAEYKNYNYAMLCQEPLPSFEVMGNSHVGQGERQDEVAYCNEARKSNGFGEPTVIPKNRHGAFAAMASFPESTTIMLAHLEQYYTA
jgi:hypothetical protein